MIIKGGNVIDSDFKLRKCDIEIQKGVVVNIGESLSGEDVCDVTGYYVLPGFIDTHIHGAYGTETGTENINLEAMCRFEATQGVTGLAITTSTSELESLISQMKLISASAKAGIDGGSKILGIHAEGPFISKNRKGAMNENHILQPSIDNLDRLINSSNGHLKILTVAPEVEGAIELIRYAVSRGITVSLGHTIANYDETLSGIKAGATQLTHTFNAMVGINHREPGVLGVGLLCDDIICEMICDYVHLHPAIVQMIYKLKGADHINIISDSSAAAGLDLTEFAVDGLPRYVKNGVIRLADGTIAGSTKTMLDGVKNLISSGIPLGDVSKMASLNPAKSLKVEKNVGSIAVGKMADIIVLDKAYNVVSTYVNGVCVYDVGK